jgi:ribulose 1,5-bisphosphate synthetase/thiazole synthase
MCLVRATWIQPRIICLKQIDTFLTREASKRVCIIGAGANGLATLKVLAETHQVQSGQWSLVAFEERDNVGGTWYLQHHSFSSHFFIVILLDLGIPPLPPKILP